MTQPITLLVTGGTGFIGSHVCVLLLEAGYRVIILDNLSNSCADVIDSIEHLTQHRPLFIQGDIRDRALLARIFHQHPIAAVLHFAGLKAVGESVANPLNYYDNNVAGSLQLVQAMQDAKINKLIFSSSATVYGAPHYLPITEQHPLQSTNPYGQSKLVVEQLLRDWHQSQPNSAIICLRYFNPVGAHPSGLLGEKPSGTPNNLMPFIMQVASGQQEILTVFGDDYPTPDGTGVRDYLHVMDLAFGHVLGLEKILSNESLCLALNLGTGTGYSVLAMIASAERTTGQVIPYCITPRRKGDIAACWADPSAAQQQLGWLARYDLDTMCADAWRWTQYQMQKIDSPRTGSISTFSIKNDFHRFE